MNRSSLRDVFRYDTLIVGGPTYNGGLYPPVARLLDLIAARCVPQRNFGWFGSFCWASAAVRCLGEFAQKMKWKAICEPVEMKQGFLAGMARGMPRARSADRRVHAPLNQPKT